MSIIAYLHSGINRKTRNPLVAWLKARTSSLVYGRAVNGVPKPNMTKERLVNYYNTYGHGFRPTSQTYQRHFECQETLYFYGTGFIKSQETLLMIDVDVYKSKGLGSPEGAEAFAGHVRRRFQDLFGQDVYFEPSTHGNGQQGFIRVGKAGVGDKYVNNAARHFERWLRKEAENVGADIELVEVKGTCPEVDWHQKGGIANIKYGSLAKLPRGEGVMTTAVVSAEKLLRLTVEEQAKVEPPQPKPKKTIPGSVSGKHISPEDLARLPVYALFAGRNFGERLEAACRFIVTPQDWAQFFILMRFFDQSQAEDGNLPVRRVGALWTALYQAGDFERPWNHHRFKAMRDHLSRHGHIDWLDNNYCLPDEKGKNGRACRWSLTAGLLLELQTASCVDTTLSDGNGQWLLPQFRPRFSVMDPDLWRQAEEMMESFCEAA